MSNSKTIRVAVIGCGRISGHHCRSIAKTPGIELAAVCDLVAERADAYSKEFKVPFFTDYRKMFADVPGIDVVAIATPSGMHFEHGLEVLKTYKKHIIIEKPTFLKPSQITEAYKAAKSLGLEIFPVFQNRHNAAVRRVLKGLKDGELGALRIAAVRVRWCRPQRYYDLAPWRGTFAQDGGALTNQGIHHVDLLRQFAGEPKRVSAVMKTLGANIEVEDTVVGVIEFESGAVGTLEVTTAARPDDFEASISLVCEKGLAQIGGIAVNELQAYTPAPKDCAAASEDFSRCVYGFGHEALYREISAFFHEGQAFSVAQDDALRTIRLLNAFYRSAESGSWVAVDSLEESPRLGRADETLASLYRTPAR
jgi:UDP-N-acetyl-2-amino-2-deoxyglucuronate dehydrogenase